MSDLLLSTPETLKHHFVAPCEGRAVSLAGVSGGRSDGSQGPPEVIICGSLPRNCSVISEADPPLPAWGLVPGGSVVRTHSRKGLRRDSQLSVNAFTPFSCILSGTPSLSYLCQVPLP